MAIDLTGRVCVITGAASGIGAAVARGFAQRGATVVATDREPPTDASSVMRLAWDVTDVGRAAEIMTEVVQRFGRLDAFVANAGIMPRQPWDQVTPDDWRSVLSVNLDGVWHGAQAAGKIMVKQGYGKIVTVSSIEVILGVAVHTHYDASKAGLIGLTRSLARALGPQGVRVNCIMPGGVRTEMELVQFPDQDALNKELAKTQCLPTRLTPVLIEPSFAFLCSAESDSITGQVLCVDHGWVHW